MTYGAIWDPATAESLGARPSVYVNFEAAEVPAPVFTADGIVFAIGVADWGPVETSVDIDSPVQVNKYLGTDPTNTTRRAVLDALQQGARKVIFHRIAANTAAQAVLDLNDTDVTPSAALRVQGKYPGTFGNTLRAEVVTNLVDNSKKDLNIYEGTVKRETFTGTDNDAIVADYTAKGSDLVVLTQQGAANRTLANITATPLATGASGTGVVAGDYTDALAIAQASRFRVLVADTTDDSIQASIAAWVDSERAGGNRVKAVLAAGNADSFSDLTTQAAALDSEAVSYLVTGYTKDGLARPPVVAAFTVAAIIAVQDTQSITHFVIPDATAISRRFTGQEYRTGLEKGLLILSSDGEKVFIEQGLNTLQVSSQVAPKSVDWRKIRYVAIQDEFVDRVGVYLGDNFIGKVSNDERGRQEAVNQVQTVLNDMVSERLLLNGVITLPDGTTEDVSPKAFLDPRYVSDQDRVYVAVTGRAADAIEKFFITVAI